MKTSTVRNKIFYGYWSLLAAAAGVFIFAGGGLFSFGFFVKPIQADMGWDRGAIMMGNTVWFLFLGFACPLAGRMVDRHGARIVITIGAVITGLGFMALSLMHGLWLFYASYALTGMGMAAIGQVPASAVASNWFIKRRGLAIGLVSMAVGLGGLLFSPLVGGFIIPVLGWRMGYLFMALFTWVLILPLSIFVIRTKPEEKGLCPDGMNDEELADLKSCSMDIEGFSLRMALATPAFWLILMCFLLHQIALNGAMQTNAPYLSDIGFPAAMIASLVGLMGMMSAAGKFGFGWICDWMKAKYSLIIGLCLQLIAMLIILQVNIDSSMTLLVIYSVMLGIGIGSWLPTMSILVSSNCGLIAYGAIFGIMSLANSVGSAFGPMVSGTIYNMTGSYRSAFFIFLVLYVISIPLILLVKKPGQPADGHTSKADSNVN